MAFIPAPQPVVAPVNPPRSAVASAPAPARQAAPVAPPPPAPAPPPGSAPQSALWSRAQLEVLAGGNISEVFGPLFAELDQYDRLVRMPEPPLLLADRVMSIEGEPGTMGTGRIVTETDVDPDAWYMHNGRMSPGVVIESGQADLLLASWLGADFHNRGERVYRLLGCDLTFMGELPKGGETLRYDIHIDGHAKHGDTRLFFFHYDCYIGDRLMISVRNGQAGFFSDEELSQSDGVLWDAADDVPRQGARRDEPPRVTPEALVRPRRRRRLHRRARLHLLRRPASSGPPPTPAPRKPPRGRLRLIDEVAEFQPDGGPWGRGYLRATASVPKDAWFYDGHFKNDPCMPGTLMADAATQALSFAMAAYGFTIERDGWRFEPVPDEMARFVCRGPGDPGRGPSPRLRGVHRGDRRRADRRRSTPRCCAAATGSRSSDAVASGCGWFRTGRCRPVRRGRCESWRAPRTFAVTTVRCWPAGAVCRRMRSAALYAPFDGTRRAPRLPDEPYHFVSRILSVDSPPGVPTKGGTVVAEYDVPADAWYFEDGRSSTVPLSVLIEILLQPCGWLSSYNGFAANRPDDVVFRNLDGNEVVLVKPAEVGTLRITSTLERYAEGGGSTIVFFDVTCTQGDHVVMTMKTAFGFFSPEALKNQVGLKVEPGGLEALSDAGAGRACRTRADELRGDPWLAQGRLQVIDRVNFWPDGGVGGSGSAGRRVRRPPRGVVLQGALLPGPGATRFAGSGGHAAGGPRGGQAWRAGTDGQRVRDRRRGSAVQLEVPRAGGADQQADPKRDRDPLGPGRPRRAGGVPGFVLGRRSAHLRNAGDGCSDRRAIA